MEPKAKALFAVALWASVAAVSKLLLGGMAPETLLFISTLISAAFFLVFDAVRKRPLEGFSLKTAMLGILGMFLSTYLFFLALNVAPASTVAVANYTWPAWIVLISSLVEKRLPSAGQIGAILAGLAGVSLIYNPSDFSSATGILLALAGALAWALFSAIPKHGKDPVSEMKWYSISALVPATVVFLLSGSHMPGIYGLLGATYVGLFPTALAFLLWVEAMESGDKAGLSILGFLTPALSLLFIFLVASEPVSMRHIAGIALVTLATILANRK